MSRANLPNVEDMMAKITKKNGSCKLYINYELDGQRKVKSTGLDDTPQNRKIVEKQIIPKLLHAIATGEVERRKAPKFREYGAEFLKNKEGEKSYFMKLATRKKVIDFFGEQRVDEITRLDVKRYLGSLPIKSQSKALYLTTIRGILDLSLDDETIVRNVAVGIGTGKNERAQADPFSQAEVERILSHADGILKNFLGISFYTGMRSGEVLGLMRHDIDFKAGTIAINRSVSKGVISKPKTEESVRVIPMFDAVRPYLQDQMSDSMSLYLFNIDGQPLWDVSVLRKRKWHKLLESLDIRYRKIYATRHTFITAMLNSGKFKLLDIAKLVGHTTVETIIDHYAGYVHNEHLKIDASVDIFRGKFGESRII
ncbi:MAG: tyrosine-type recombinase/integrase [Campylobacterales bacterium]|nr:tyrosine-type recombinase/integrase [Campylobacterales bacterium]